MRLIAKSSRFARSFRQQYIDRPLVPAAQPRQLTVVSPEGQTRRSRGVAEVSR